MYLAWFDANPKKPTTQKIAEAHERYVEKFGRKPLVCLVNPDDMIADSPVELRPLQHISRHCFWIGVDEAAAPAPEIPAAVRAPRGKKPQVEASALPVVEPQPQAPVATPRVRKPKAAPASVVEETPPTIAPPVPAAAPRARKPKIAPVAVASEPVAAPVEAPAPAKRARKAKVAPVSAPPMPVVAPEPTVVPAPKRRPRREKVAA